MPLSKKGQEIMKAMKDQYGDKKGPNVFYASKEKGTIQGVEDHGLLKEAFRKERRKRRK